MTYIADEFVLKVVDHLQAHHAGAVGTTQPSVLRQRVEVAIAKGMRYGFTQQSSLAGFATLMFEVAPNFDEHPAFQRALEFRNLSEDDRILSIYDRVSDQEWREAQERYNDEAWRTAPPNGER